MFVYQLHSISCLNTMSILFCATYCTLSKEDTLRRASVNMEKVFANQKKHLDSVEKRVRADALKDTPKPTPDGDSKTMTLEKFRKLSPAERAAFFEEHPEEYKELYGGN